MKRALVAALALALGAVAHAAPQPLVRVQIEGKQPVLVGQPVRIDVQVLAPNFFLSPPRFPVLDIPGAVVTLDERATNTTETIDGESYAGIQKSYVVTPQQAGELRSREVRIAFSYAAEPGKPGVPGSVMLPAQKLSATIPAGAETAGAAESTAPVAKVELTQTLDRDVKGMRVGDTLTRTIESFAASTQAMMIPPPELDAPAGVRVYRRDPVLTDVNDGRGGFVGGKRIDRVTYSFDAAGTYTLPAVEVGWLDAATGKRETARAPEIVVSVASASAFASAIAPEAPSFGDTSMAALGGRDARAGLAAAIGLIALLLAGAWVVRRQAPAYRAALEERRRARAESEQRYFARLQQACAADDPAAAYGALRSWTMRLGADSIASLTGEHATLRGEVDALEQRLYGAAAASGGWSGRGLATAAESARRSFVASRSEAVAARALPALNPWDDWKASAG